MNFVALEDWLLVLKLIWNLNLVIICLHFTVDVLLVQNGLEELTKAVTSLREDQLGMTSIKSVFILAR